MAMKDEKKRMKLLRARSIKPNFMELKNYRVKADYHNERLTNHEINEVKRFVKTFDDSYQIIFNEL
ncbi:hypothetical protein [Staphylococcus rostri]|uniref:hypothetical protein n=1 Tax=Staphylococcus rostri TaxID=522262 RepID=UPI0026DFCE44|nr:hypothetical protein [Staphylococcus rostri]